MEDRFHCAENIAHELCNTAFSRGILPCRFASISLAGQFLYRVGLLDQPSPGISAAARCARPGHWGTKGIFFSTAPILPMFAASFVHCIRMVTVPWSVLCGTRTRRLSALAQQPFSAWLMTSTKTHPHKQMLAEWSSGLFSLCPRQRVRQECLLLNDKPPSSVTYLVWDKAHQPEQVGCSNAHIKTGGKSVRSSCFPTPRGMFRVSSTHIVKPMVYPASRQSDVLVLCRALDITKGYRSG